MDYLCFGSEVCPDTLRHHWQGFVAFKKRGRIGLIKKIDQFKSVHLEQSRGSIQANQAYCSKDGLFTEYGVAPVDKQSLGGKRRAANYNKILEDIRSGAFESIPPDIFIRHYRTIKEIRRDFLTTTTNRSLVPGTIVGLWIQGPPGIGKSHWVRNQHPVLYDKPLNKWWDNYNGEPVAILDDMDLFHKCLGNLLKRWADVYPFPAETKGAIMNIRPRAIVVTSNYSIRDIWPDDLNLMDALCRRFQSLEIYVRAALNDINFTVPDYVEPVVMDTSDPVGSGNNESPPPINNE